MEYVGNTRVHDDTGAELDASFSVEIQPDGDPSIVFESRSGRAGQGAGRNNAYNLGLEFILDRLLHDARFTINGIFLVREDDLSSGVTEDTRRIPIPEYPYPITPETEISPPAHLREKLGRAMTTILSASTAPGRGNRQRHIRLNVTPPAGWSDASVSLVDVLANCPVTAQVPGHAQEPSVAIAPRTEFAIVREPRPSSVDVGLASREALETVTSDQNGDRVGTPRTGSGQGRSSDAARNKAIELRAMDVVTEHYAAQGWKVTDVSTCGRRFDLECTLVLDTHHVEVKGTTQAGLKVTVTAQEVKHAKTHLGTVFLAIVTGIHVPVSEQPTASGGTLSHHGPWDPRTGKLEPTQYSYEPPVDNPQS